MPLISVVIPVYGASQSLEILIDRLHQVLKQMEDDYEIILVDDCSRDDSWLVLKTLKQHYGKSLKLARLLVNVGQHNAILCGLSLSTGEIVITMDDDLQHPPDEIPKLMESIHQGFDLVIGAYDSKKHSRIRQPSGQLIDWIIIKIFGLPSNFQLTSFRATTRPVVDNVCQMGGVFPYITAMMLVSASRYTNVVVRHDPRPFGKSNYNLKRSFRLAANLIFNYSSYPLYLVVLLCFIAFLFSVILGVWTLGKVLLYGASVPGWASTVVIVSFFNGFILLCLVSFGVYLSRISQQLTGIRRPYIIRELDE